MLKHICNIVARLPLHIKCSQPTGHKIKYELCVIVMIFDLSICISDFKQISSSERPDDEAQQNIRKYECMGGRPIG
jgi:hypothetical protein